MTNISIKFTEKADNSKIYYFFFGGGGGGVRACKKQKLN
jgi:hypothetical protein